MLDCEDREREREREWNRIKNSSDSATKVTPLEGWYIKEKKRIKIILLGDEEEFTGGRT